METELASWEKWLENEDKVCRAGRRDRLEWLASRMPSAEIWTFPGGLLARCLFEEARYCYVYGQFLAATLLGFAFVERTLAAMLFAAARNDMEQARACELLEEALAYGWISHEQFNALTKARQLRNTVTHFRRPMHKSSVEARSVTCSKRPHEIVEDDAKSVIEGGLEILKRNTA